MLDDIDVLRAAVAGYRAAATATGVPWPDGGDRNEGLPADVLCRVFDVDRIPEQLLWLRSHGLPVELVLPDGAFLLKWNDAEELLEYLSFSVAIPFHWRHQLPLFFTDHLLFTFVLAGDNAGEIWRYQIDADDWNPMRAAPSLAALFTQWTNGFAAEAYSRSPYDNWLHIGYDGGDPIDLLLERDLDPLAFPVYVSLGTHEGLIRARQRECGVDIDRADEFESLEELQEAIAAACASLRG
ncbi:hypothetical protein [Micromonospora sp. NPDC093277]|uniref:hypothetical protein n=1 Tax=Micromonospora sp. NPDC093277 TaxID=3364291 RepID=UPI0038091A31